MDSRHREGVSVCLPATTLPTSSARGKKNQPPRASHQRCGPYDPGQVTRHLPAHWKGKSAQAEMVAHASLLDIPSLGCIMTSKARV